MNALYRLGRMKMIGFFFLVFELGVCLVIEMGKWEFLLRKGMRRDGRGEEEMRSLLRCEKPKGEGGIEHW